MGDGDLERFGAPPAAAETMADLQAFYDHLIGSGPMMMFAGWVTPESIVATDRMAFDVSYVSPNAHELFGPMPGGLDALPWLWFERIHPEDRGRLLERRASAPHADERTDQIATVYRFLGDDGTYSWVETVVRFFGSRNPGEPVALHGYAIDVSAYHESEQALLAAQESLHEALIAAERASGAKTEFLSRTSHELRTPLNSILGFAELLAMDDLTEVQQESVDHILRAGKHLLALINEVLDIAQIESGRLNLTMEPVSLVEIMDITLELVAGLHSKSDVTILMAPHDQWRCYVHADHRHLVQVMVNLVSNAIKYNRDGGTVTLRRDLEDGRVRIVITDTGPGIPADRLHRVFSPFDRLEAERTTVEGTGVGLTLARGLAEEMGGRIDVESTVGVGSTFTLDLAAADEPPA
jgi:signal transduction histidine kinase